MSMDDTNFAPATQLRMLGEWGGVVEYGGGAKGQFASFYWRSVENAAKSKMAGRRICEDKVYVRIAPPGERLNIIDREVTDLDKQRWPVQWAQFQQNQMQRPEGTPIDLLFPASPATADTMKGFGVHTIEQCAELSAHAIDNIMGGQEYCNKAKTYLEASNKGVAYHKFQTELADRDGKIRVLENLVQTLRSEVEQMRQHQNPQLLEQMTALLSGAQARPVFPTSGNLSAPFDAQAAQIAANHPTADIARNSRTPRRSRRTTQ
jgi:hypothetical protein